MNVVHASTARRRESLLTPSLFPPDAHAIIYKVARSAMTCAPALKEEWRLRLERRTPLRAEPLMGWTEDDDPLSAVELSFPSAEAVIRYAHRQELDYTVMDSPSREAGLRIVGNKQAATEPQLPQPKPKRVNRTMQLNRRSRAPRQNAA